MIPHLALLLGLQLTGEVVARGLSLPVPGPILGLLLLLVIFAVRPGVATALRPTTRGLLGYMSLLFVPAGVGIVGHLDLFAQQGLALVLTLIGSTLLAIVAASLAFAGVARLTGAEDGGRG
ncbi:CidA/LrgA family protein [Cereibacter changlensis JA139]|uniref:CidA/LrgA family protein n=2 Tax=Cereibacter changlensis TaxID=402884 RepID=A0A2T4JP10_9RHOB|nr:CidA/LrgA family protein [Cereibacter changlensis]PTE19636.1 CidA/LrgA family protein [Cereibacter changlensis JA139]PZX46057.1 putative effector of murein hydrolase LrgA (UPF0299 family) [Cereibacter changlensis]